MAQIVSCILAFDTSTPTCVVALFNKGELFSITEHAPMQQGKLILSTIQEILSRAALSLEALDCIAYGAGPGAFTGIRIANSVAQGLSLASQVPLVPLSSLSLLAHTAYLVQPFTSSIVAVDARMEEIYWARYDAKPEEGVYLVGDEKVSKLREVSLICDDQFVAIGDAWEKGLLPLRELTVIKTAHPSAKALILLAKKEWQQHGGKKPDQALPAYLR